MTTRRTAAALIAAAFLLPLAGCFGDTTTDRIDYQIDESVTALAIDGRAGGIDIIAGAGPVTVTEEYRYSKGKPTTTHRVEGKTLRLTETGCGDDDARCEIRYRIRVPAATSVDVNAQAGAVKVDGLAGNIRITTEAGAIEGHALTGDEVTVKTEVGATTLEFTEAPSLISATTSVGAVDLRVPGGTGYAVDVRAPNASEKVSVEKDASSAHRIQVRAEVGAVKIAPLP
jgi:Putative adhesin